MEKDENNEALRSLRHKYGFVYKKLSYDMYIGRYSWEKSKRDDAIKSFDDKYSFLYKRLSYKKRIISEIAFVPEYIEAIGNYRGHYDDESVFCIISDVYENVFEEEKRTGVRKRIYNAMKRHMEDKQM